MHEVFLSELHQKVSIESNVEVNVVDGVLGLLDVQVQASIKHTNCLSLVSFEAPFNKGFKEEMFCRLVSVSFS